MFLKNKLLYFSMFTIFGCGVPIREFSKDKTRLIRNRVYNQKKRDLSLDFKHNILLSEEKAKKSNITREEREKNFQILLNDHTKKLNLLKEKYNITKGQR